MSNTYPGALNNYITGVSSSTLFVAGHAAAHNAYEAKLGTGVSTPSASTVLRGTGTGTTAYGQVVLTTDVTGILPVANGGTGSATDTLTNKRITKRAPAVTQNATPTINTDVTDVAHITGLAQAITSMTTNLTGTPNEGDMLRIDFTDNGTSRAISWGASFEASGNVSLPIATVLGVRLDTVFAWNTATTKWRCVGVA